AVPARFEEPRLGRSRFDQAAPARGKPSMTSPPDDAPGSRPDPGSAQTRTLAERYRAVRAASEALADPLTAEDQQAQSMPDASPVKWHLAHTAWFFETFLLKPRLAGYQVFDPAFCYLFNSYYE